MQRPGFADVDAYIGPISAIDTVGAFLDYFDPKEDGYLFILDELKPYGGPSVARQTEL